MSAKTVLSAIVMCAVAMPGTCVTPVPPFDTYDQVLHQLTSPTMLIGAATYSDVVTVIGFVLSGPTGTAPGASTDSYAPAANLLTAPAVESLGVVKFNYTGTVAALVSIGSVSGADTYDGARLTIPFVQVDGAAAYSNVVVTFSQLVTIEGGMPSASLDQYSSGDNTLTIPALTVNGIVYTNVVVAVDRVISVGGVAPGVPAGFSYSFRGSHAIYGSGAADGALPKSGVIQASDGNFYGTTAYGGASNSGAVFRVTPSGVETVLYSFTGSPAPTASSDGAVPVAGVIQGSDGNFYGTTSAGGAWGQGTVFRLTPAGVETVLHSFTGAGGVGVSAVDGAAPWGSLIQATDGNFYGTTTGGGAYYQGTVFRLTPGGVVTVLYSFSGQQGSYGPSVDGSGPQAGLVQGSDGYLYGTTPYGGAYQDSGTVFRIDLNGFEQVLHSFSPGAPGGIDGINPIAGLTQGTDGNFYGTTSRGGLGAPYGYGSGAVFRITPSGAETILYLFGGGTGNGSQDGFYPAGGLVQGVDGNFYGTTSAGGAYGQGTVFGLTPAGVESVLHSFSGNGGLADNFDGASAQGSLIQGSDGSLYGTTTYGGVLNLGTLFRVSASLPGPAQPGMARYSRSRLPASIRSSTPLAALRSMMQRPRTAD